MESRDRLLAKIAREQHGVFTRAQALACGIGSTTIDARLRRGVYEHLHPGVLAFPATRSTWRRSVVACVFSIGQPVAASHLTAAHLWGMTDRQPSGVEIVCRRHEREHRPDVTVHESKDLISDDVVIVDGIPTTSAVRTIVDLGASARLGVVARCLDMALLRQLFALEDVDAFLARVARKGRRGVGTIRPLIKERLVWQGRTESELENFFRRVVHLAGLPMPEPQFILTEPDGTFVGRFDFAYPLRRLLIELDSERYHMDPESFQRDRDKQNRAHALGFTVYRFTYRQLMEDPSQIHRLLA